METILQAVIHQLLVELGHPQTSVKLDIPAHEAHGDYATSVAFALAKPMRQNPKQLAETLVEHLTKTRLNQWFEMEPLNGFINFKLKPRGLWDFFMQALTLPVPAQKREGRVLLEYVSANPTGPLHMGHARWAVLGNVMATILKKVGISVETEFYINDAGNQINRLIESVEAARNNQPIPEDGYHGAYIHELAQHLESPIKLNIQAQTETLSRLGVQFDHWFSETSLHQAGEVGATLERLKREGFVVEREGAWWFKSTEFGDDKDRVVIKSDGSTTYFAVDLAYHANKVSRGFDRLINIWGADHHGYVQRVRAGLAALCGSKFLQEDHFKVVIGQLVSLLRGGEQVRMSKRTGEMVTLAEVLDEIGRDAMRYFLVEKSADTHLEFDLELAKKTTHENPVYYIQYAHARLVNVLEKADPSFNSARLDVALDAWRQNPDVGTQPFEPAERALMVQGLRFYDTLEQAAFMLAPHYMAQYAASLAKKIQVFYEHCSVLKAQEPVRTQRLVLIAQTLKILRETLTVLGIAAPNRM